MPAQETISAPLPCGQVPSAKNCSGNPGRADSPTSPFLLSFAAEQVLAAEVQSLTTSGEGDSTWSPRNSEKLYSIAGWGAPYFSISEAGHLCVSPQSGELTALFRQSWSVASAKAVLTA